MARAALAVVVAAALGGLLLLAIAVDRPSSDERYMRDHGTCNARCGEDRGCFAECLYGYGEESR